MSKNVTYILFNNYKWQNKKLSDVNAYTSQFTFEKCNIAKTRYKSTK
jgi:hypothetical protein